MRAEVAQGGQVGLAARRQRADRLLADAVGQQRPREVDLPRREALVGLSPEAGDVALALLVHDELLDGRPLDAGGERGVPAVGVRRARLGGVAPLRDLVGLLAAAVGGGVGGALLAASRLAIDDELDAVAVGPLHDVPGAGGRRAVVRGRGRWW